MKKLDAREWNNHVIGGQGEQRSVQLPLKNATSGVDISIRCPAWCVVNGITLEGETVPLAAGMMPTYRGKLIGFGAIEVVTDKDFSYRLLQKTRWFETPDPTPVVAPIDERADKPIEDMIKEGIAKQLHRWKLDNVFADDVEVEELLDDLQNGELEFEEEEDHYGLPSARHYEAEDEQLDMFPSPEDPAPAEPPEAAKSGSTADGEKKGGGAPATPDGKPNTPLT